MTGVSCFTCKRRILLSKRVNQSLLAKEATPALNYKSTTTTITAITSQIAMWQVINVTGFINDS